MALEVTMRNTLSRKARSAGGIDDDDAPAILASVCSTGDAVLAAHTQYHGPAAPGSPDRCWVARSLRTEFESVLHDADVLCRGRAELGACRRGLERLRHLCLDLTADAVSPSGEDRFARDLELLRTAWAAWQAEARMALRA